MPAMMYLEEFGSQVWMAFGHPPYLVGSAAQSKKWRDVDVRLILDDKYCLKLFGTIELNQTNGRWMAMCMAFSALGQRMTGLPIDFQIQSMTMANFPNRFPGPRQHLGGVELRYMKKCQNTPHEMLLLADKMHSRA